MFPEIVIYGATHVGLTLANCLAKELNKKILVVDQLHSPPEAPHGWDYHSSEMKPVEQIDHAETVYIVTDEDKVNIRMALVIRNYCNKVRIVVALAEPRLGKKLARHMDNFYYLSPSELAAKRFIEAIYLPCQENRASNVQSEQFYDPESPKTSSIDPLIVQALTVITLIASFAVVYFHYADKLSWIDSIYFVVTMMCTVGFGDINLKDSSTMSKVIGIILMLVSFTTTAAIFALITDSLLRHRIVLTFGSRKVKVSNHIIVVGCGSVGSKVVDELIRLKEAVVAIDNQPSGRYMPAVFSKRVPTIIGDARSGQILKSANIEKAKAILSVTNDDLTNLEVGLNAKFYNPNLRVILRIYDQMLAQSLQEKLEVQFAFSMSSVAATALAEFAY
ncbi:MAG: potassium channel family protein, partial [Blastocatellia bacterium]|nr:potassium channel family protein [Blastocatellia bacterium]